MQIGLVTTIARQADEGDWGIVYCTHTDTHTDRQRDEAGEALRGPASEWVQGEDTPRCVWV